MPTVYRTKTNPARGRFHKTDQCVHLTRKTTGVRQEVIAVDLKELSRGIPCRTCYVDAPKIASAHRYCAECNKKTARPCPHNGGIPVVVTMTRKSTRTLFSEPGDTYTKHVYVWPEKLHLFAS